MRHKFRPVQTMSLQQLRAIQQAKDLLKRAESNGVPRRVAIQAGIRNLKLRGLDQLSYGQHAVAWLENELLSTNKTI